VCSSYSLSCCTSFSSGASPNYIAGKIGYSSEEINNLPEESVLGLGCGNPVSFAGLKEGKTVLDLGSVGYLFFSCVQ
jgi:hypothetical protein